MSLVTKPPRPHATALVSLSTCGAITGFTFAHGTASDLTAPAGLPVRLLAPGKPASSASSRDSALRSAIVSVARHYLQLAQRRTSADMESLIWQADSIDGVDHGESCAAFASLTLALGAQAVGQQSWVTGGGSYPWPLHQWADVRVQPNPASLGVVSVLQDAQAHHRWHPLGDGYRPQPGDWVLFDGHVEVVTGYTGGALDTIGGDSLPGLTVNAHTFPAPLAAQGVLGFVNNGELVAAAGRDGQPAAGGPEPAAGAAQVPGAGTQLLEQVAPSAGTAVIPGAQLPADPPGSSSAGSSSAGRSSAGSSSAGSSSAGSSSAGRAAPAYGRHHPLRTGVPGTAAQQAFIEMVATGAVATKQQYGIPAAVTIAQAIDESGWGQSTLAVADHNLFGIKGTGPAGRHMLPTQEYENGAWVTRAAPFRVYRNVAESIADHGRLLATNQAYQHAMADRQSPDAFAAALTGVYATDPDYGTHLITLMQQYNLYRYDAATPAAPQESQVTRQPVMALAAVPGVSAPGTPGQHADTGASGALAVTGASGVTPGALADTAAPGRASIPGVAGALAAGAVRARAAGRERRTSGSRTGGPGPRITPRASAMSARRYAGQMPPAVTARFAATAKSPLTRAQPLYQDVARRSGLPWELLAACDWMQCQAEPGYSPVHGERLGTANPDGTIFLTRSAALNQCASELIELAAAVYLIDVTVRRPLSVRELANVFAAFRWGGLLRVHRISALEFPYSVAGLTARHLKMRWPDINDRHAPDKPGARFRGPFGAVPVVLSLGYRAAAMTPVR